MNHGFFAAATDGALAARVGLGQLKAILIFVAVVNQSKRQALSMNLVQSRLLVQNDPMLL